VKASIFSLFFFQALTVYQEKNFEYEDEVLQDV
jgi:hypothetical protein